MTITSECVCVCEIVPWRDTYTQRFGHYSGVLPDSFFRLVHYCIPQLLLFLLHLFLYLFITFVFLSLFHFIIFIHSFP